MKNKKEKDDPPTPSSGDLRVLVKRVWEYSERGALLPENDIRLEKDASNIHDPNAVKVMLRYPDTERVTQVGYIEAGQSKTVTDILNMYPEIDYRVCVVPPLNSVQAVLNIVWGVGA